jgi:hypothetical protein
MLSRADSLKIASPALAVRLLPGGYVRDYLPKRILVFGKGIANHSISKRGRPLLRHRRQQGKLVGGFKDQKLWLYDYTIR